MKLRERTLRDWDTHAVPPEEIVAPSPWRDVDATSWREYERGLDEECRREQIAAWRCSFEGTFRRCYILTFGQGFEWHDRELEVVAT